MSTQSYHSMVSLKAGSTKSEVIQKVPQRPVKWHELLEQLSIFPIILNTSGNKKL